MEAYYKEQGMFHTASSPEAEYTDVLRIDLNQIEPSIAGPKRPQDRVELERALGEGEVQATVNARGLSTVRETRIAGVWWIEHRDPQGELVAELLEVTRVPEILAGAPDDIAAAAQTLREYITTTATARTS